MCASYVKHLIHICVGFERTCKICIKLPRIHVKGIGIGAHFKIVTEIYATKSFYADRTNFIKVASIFTDLPNFY